MARLADGAARALPHDQLRRRSDVFSVTVRDHMMVAHSLRGEVFGPAQRLHGATYVVDAAFRGPTSTRRHRRSTSGGHRAAHERCSAELTYRNLDDEPTSPVSTRPPRCSPGWSPTPSSTRIHAG